MLRTRTGEQLDTWLQAIASSPLTDLKSFAASVYEDKEAIVAGLTRAESNGPVEGQVNRLKLIKRSMYGQADLNLLKLRVLHQSPKNLERKNKKKQAQQKEPLKVPRGMKKNTNFQHTTHVITKVA
jgi:Transposase